MNELKEDNGKFSVGSQTRVIQRDLLATARPICAGETENAAF
jgi:hypothetical protein